MDTKHILNFLTELSNNNSVEWMHAHKKQYDKAKNDFLLITQSLIDRLILIDSSLLWLDAKKCVFRLARDTRFSSDKRPYKDYFSAYIVSGGKKTMKAGYYFHLQPDNQTLIAGGMHSPPQNVLTLLRNEILNNGQVLESILNNIEFKKNFPDLVGESLKLMPRGFPSEHKYQKYLKMKSFDAIYYYEDSFVQNVDLLMDDMCNKFKLVQPLNGFFNEALVDYVFTPPFSKNRNS